MHDLRALEAFLLEQLLKVFAELSMAKRFFATKPSIVGASSSSLKSSSVSFSAMRPPA